MNFQLVSDMTCCYGNDPEAFWGVWRLIIEKERNKSKKEKKKGNKNVEKKERKGGNVK